MNKSTVGIIILNWNTIELTRQCLKSLLTITDFILTIVVVDNGSKKNEAKILHQEFEQCQTTIHVIRLNQNMGFTGGCNEGITIAKKYNPQFYLLLNNDTEVEPTFLKYLIQTTKVDESVGIASPVLYDYHNKSRILFSGGKINWFFARPYHVTTPITHTTECDFLTGCCLLIKKEVINTLNGLDNRLFAYFEDAAFCLQAKQCGFRCVCVPEAKVYHYESASSGKSSVFYTYLFSRNRVLFIKYYAPKVFQAYYAIFFFLKWVTASMYFLFTNQIARLKTYSKGYWDGLMDKNGIPNI